MTDVSEAAAALGRKGGASRSPAKLAAARANIRKAASSMSASARRDRARRAAQARWHKADRQSDN